LNIPMGPEDALSDNFWSYDKLSGSWNQESHLLSTLVLTTNPE
jgi:hypothetical protein